MGIHNFEKRAKIHVFRLISGKIKGKKGGKQKTLICMVTGAPRDKMHLKIQDGRHYYVNEMKFD